MAGISSAAYLLASTSLSSEVRTSGYYLITTASPNPYAALASADYMVTSLSPNPYPADVSAMYMVHMVSLSSRVEFEFIESGEIYGINRWEYQASEGIVPEWNPYRPRIPENMIKLGDDFYNFYEENQNIHRQQHNLQQAGDTTFPYQMFLRTHAEKEYTLGSISRFFHEEWGNIHCRYVQFDKMIQTDQPASPVGLFKKAESHEWVVTNRFDLSDPDLAVGIIPNAGLPTNGEYGWVIVDGPLQQELVNESNTATIGETFAWSATGKVSNVARGRVLGRRVNKVGDSRLRVGQMYVQLESYSLEDIRLRVIEASDGLAAAIAQLQEDVDAIKALTTADETFKKLKQTLEALQNQLNTERTERKAADAALHNRINNLNFVTASQLGAAVANLQNSIATIQTLVTNQLNSVKADITLIKNLIDNLNLTGIQTQLAALSDTINLIDKKPRSKFPVVDGSIPPNLVYMDDGSLVYTEIL